MTEAASRLIRSGSPQSCHPHERYLLRSTDWDALPDALRQEPALELLGLWAEPGLVHAAFLKRAAEGGAPARLTNTAAIDTSPSYSPDGSRIVFESDRGGNQQLYVMSAGGGGATRISFGNGRYGTPVWSPRGDLIAFTRQSGSGFAIGVMKPDGSGERILTEGFHNEGPTWAPNGRVIMFFRDAGGPNGGPQLWSVDLTGRNEQRIPTPNFASDPAWSPLLK